MIIADAVRLYLNQLVVDGRSRHTVTAARSALRDLQRTLDPLSVDTVAQLDHDALMKHRENLATRLTDKGRPLTAGSQSVMLHSIKSFCRWLVREQHLLSDPAKKIPIPRKPKRLPKGLLEAEDIEAMRKQVDLHSDTGYRNRVVLEVLYATGLRREEVANLTLADLDLSIGYLTVRQGKGAKDRVVPLGDGLIRWLDSYLKGVRTDWPGSDTDHHLFLNRFGRGMHPHGIWSIVHKLAKAADLPKPVSTHSFRHACATHMLRNGAPIRHIQELLGHESLETTQLYTRVTITDLKAVHRRYHPSEQQADAENNGDKPTLENLQRLADTVSTGPPK